MPSFDAIDAALQTAKSAWKGCDWNTVFGQRQVNLCGLSSRQSRLAAQATRGEESLLWQSATEYLETVERDARSAADLANHSVELWKRGDLAKASLLVTEAIAIEAKYRPPIAYPKLLDSMTQHAPPDALAEPSLS